MIKDSGERTKFGTGAVRDMHAGKGRMDLLPLSALIELSKHCEEGAQSTASTTWTRGSRSTASATRLCGTWSSICAAIQTSPI